MHWFCAKICIWENYLMRRPGPGVWYVLTLYCYSLTKLEPSLIKICQQVCSNISKLGIFSFKISKKLCPVDANCFSRVLVSSTESLNFPKPHPGFWLPWCLEPKLASESQTALGNISASWHTHNMIWSLKVLLTFVIS